MFLHTPYRIECECSRKPQTCAWKSRLTAREFPSQPSVCGSARLFCSALVAVECCAEQCDSNNNIVAAPQSRREEEKMMGGARASANRREQREKAHNTQQYGMRGLVSRCSLYFFLQQPNVCCVSSAVSRLVCSVRSQISKRLHVMLKLCVFIIFFLQISK
jgi:hypothetical protein